MAKKLSLVKQEELFTKECKVINLLYEYSGYTGQEKWAIVTELTEKELRNKYPNVIHRYTPFILLSMAQGEVIKEYQNNEAKERMRNLRFGFPFDINEKNFETFHFDVVLNEDVIEQIICREKIERIRKAINLLTEIQKRRIIKYFFGGMTYREIAYEECVTVSKIKNSINASLKKIKNFMKQGEQNPSPSSNK